MDVKRGKKDKNGAKDTSKDINPKSGGKEVPKAHGKDKAPGTHTSYIFFYHSWCITSHLGHFG